MAEGNAGMSAAATSAVDVGGSRRLIGQLSRAAVTDVLQYTPHIPSICCAAAHPHLRYAREAVAGTRVAEGSAHHRSDLYVCWDWTTNCEYHSLSGAEEELEADLRQLGWWLTRPFTEDGKPMTMEVNVKREVSYHPPLSSTPSATAAATEAPPAGFEGILLILTQPPFQRTDVGISCLRSLIVTPNRKEVSKTAMELIGQLAYLEKLESFTQFLTLPLPSLTSVSVLRLHNVRALTSLESLVPLSGLKRISLCRCASLHSLAALSQLRELKELRLSDCRVLDARGNYSACRRLTSVSMRWCGAVLHVGDLATLPNLRDLDCSYSGVRNLESLTQFSQLRRLCLRGCHSIHELFHAMDAFAALLEPPGAVAANEISSAFLDRVAAPTIVDQHVSLSAVNKLTSTGEASAPPACTLLYPALSTTMPSPASSFSQLEELDVGESSLVSLSGLPQCAPELRHLTVRECQQLHSLSPLGELLKLTSVDASFSGVDDLEGLSESVSLQYVNLRNCVRLRTAASLARVRSLHEIDLSAANQNCIICVCNNELDKRNERTAGPCARRRRSEPLRQRLLMLSGPVGGVDDIRIDTAVTQRSSHRLVQHCVLRQEAEALLRQPLEQVLATEARLQEEMW
ncbi:hypothetical protein LMJF_31_1160 [Leishmania major strain Friedlin]|uniref:Leucine-rich repeat protein (LRRP) n=1 Tax=Leishmania major TaxID=5664 RepID=Q4Q6E7_LEIMA|nr:hypothetical protein LMJF_31_1160 [Leishmania major strain Friedlin]CAG9579280.1 hypothetical_protein_-_conserved [Leishmania major strain Friedlin]CAJ08303.1 hypothetical protein LMJF_31_1160 [Leishmania major strain Friedlin]|eukprot:XP_001685101.1 hypothetical protein LMJF_31_1160 [Leishmania major strain Friedlin]